MTKGGFSYGSFIEYFLYQPKGSDYWKDGEKFCKEVLAGCDVCWTCKIFNVIDCKCEHYTNVIKEPGKQKCPWFQPKKHE